MGKLGGEMKALAKHCGGSHKTVNDCIHIVQRFDHHLRALNVHIQRVAQIKVRHIESYIHERLAQGIGKRTLQNEMASLRAVLQQAGRKQVAEHEWLTNKSLGLAGASRSGTRQAITPEHYHHVLETARMKDPGLAAALELARLMGLRSQEAVQSVQWIWGMGTGVGGMWRRCMGKFDSWLRASSGWSRLPPFTVSERLGGGGKYQAALPSPYSPNLNPIERMWKLMNEHARNNRYFSSTREFRDAISVFFNQTLPDIADSLTSRIKDHFQVLTPAS